MRTPLELINYLSAHGVVLSMAGSELRAAAPKNVLTPVLKGEIARHKAEILEILAKSGSGPARPGNLTKSASVVEELPLSSGQNRLLTLMRTQPESDVYTISWGHRLEGVLNVAALKQSLYQIQRRHQILRTVFVEKSNGFVARVVEDMPVPFSVIDPPRQSPALGKDGIHEILDAETRLLFKFNEGPLWSCKLMRLSGNSHVLIFAFHHIVFDGYSKAVFLNELSHHYGVLAGETFKELPALPVQYGDFALWQQNWSESESAESQLAYWSAQFQGDIQELKLPYDHPVTSATPCAGKSLPFRCSAAVSEKLGTLSRQRLASIYMTLLASFYALLNRYTGQEDMTVCSPVAGRNFSNLEQLIGYFNNIVPLRICLGGNPDFQELVDRVRSAVVGANMNEQLPFHCITGLPNLTRINLTRGMFNLRVSDTHELPLSGLTASLIENRRHHADFDLALYFGMDESGLYGFLDYNSEAFDESTIVLLEKNFQLTLEAVTANPARRLNSLPRFGHDPGEVATLLKQHAKISDAVVTGGNGANNARSMIAYVVLNEFEVPTMEELQEFLREKLPHYLLPSDIVPVDKLPLTKEGDIDLASLSAHSQARHVRQTEYIAPRTALEVEFAEIWQREMWLDQPVGIDDDFAELGGHSLLSVRLIGAMEKHLGRRLPQAALSPLTTIAHVVSLLGDEPKRAISVKTETNPGEAAQISDDLFQALRQYTASWEGTRDASDSLIVGLNTQGTSQPFFWCGQNFHQPKQLAKYFGADQPVYAMRSGYQVMEKIQDNIDSLGAYYADEILKIQSGGPFLIGGSCQATFIAFQIARQLIRKGHEISLLCLQEKLITHDYPGPIAFFFGKESNRNNYVNEPYLESSELRNLDVGIQIGIVNLGGGKIQIEPDRNCLSGFEVNIIKGRHGQFFDEPNIQDFSGKLTSAFERSKSPSVAPVPVPRRQCLQHLDGLNREPRFEATLTVDQVAGNDWLVAFDIQNQGTETWLSGVQGGIELSVHCCDLNNELVQVASALTNLPVDLKPGQGTQLRTFITIPATMGKSVLRIGIIDPKEFDPCHT